LSLGVGVVMCMIDPFRSTHPRAMRTRRMHVTVFSTDWIIHLAVDGETYEVTVTRGRKAVIKVPAY
jgi:hypothetical protein